MSEYGFSVLAMDEDTRSAVLDYLEASKHFFALPTEQKVLLSENEAMKKKNEGYLVVEGVKEYLKVYLHFHSAHRI